MGGHKAALNPLVVSLLDLVRNDVLRERNGKLAGLMENSSTTQPKATPGRRITHMALSGSQPAPRTGRKQAAG